MQLRGTPDVGRILALPVALITVALGGVVTWSVFSLGRAIAVAAISALLFGVFQLGRALYVLDRRRRRADEWLRTATGEIVPPAYAWRAAQLTSSRHRRMLARTLRLIERSAGERPLGGYRPLLIAARRRRVALESLARMLERENEPVTPAGMLRIVDLVTMGAGPLWGTSDEALGDAIDTRVAVLTPRSASRGACAV